MTEFVLDLLCDPVTKSRLQLEDAVRDEDGAIISGNLRAESGTVYPIVNGIPRFIPVDGLQKTVTSFGDEWNFFNFVAFKENWLEHTVKNTFGSIAALKDQVMVDCGGGSGAQTMWMLESGAKHVIMLELSHSVDGVVQKNLKDKGFKNVDIIQCSIDNPPLLPNSVKGIVICHNVIQHTQSVEKTAKALYNIVAPGGEFDFNCYRKYNVGLFRKFRYHVIFMPLRAVLKRMPFAINLAYARLMGVLRLVPGVGISLEKLAFLNCGDVPNKTGWDHAKHIYKATVLNTFDCFGSHAFQHYKSDDELKALINELQPDASKVKNVEKYFQVPPPIGCALRIFK